MKNLLVLFVVLGMASTAMAIPTIEVLRNNQPYLGEDVEFSDVITILWWEDIQSGGYSGVDIALGIADGVSATAEDAPNTKFITTQTNTWTVTDQGGGNHLIEGGFTQFSPPPAVPWLVAVIEFHVPQLTPSDLIIFDALQGGFGNVDAGGILITDPSPGPGDGVPYAEFHYIPEPMTMSLLALGGLGLIRRRRA